MSWQQILLLLRFHFEQIRFIVISINTCYDIFEIWHLMKLNLFNGYYIIFYFIHFEKSFFVFLNVQSERRLKAEKNARSHNVIILFSISPLNDRMKCIISPIRGYIHWILYWEGLNKLKCNHFTKLSTKHI